MARRRHQHDTGTSRGGSQRQLRVAEQMRHLIAEHLIRGDLRDPRLANRHLIVAEVRVSRDLKSATVFTTELGGELTQAFSQRGGTARRTPRSRDSPETPPACPCAR